MTLYAAFRQAFRRTKPRPAQDDGFIQCEHCSCMIHPSNQAFHDRFCFGNPERERTGQYEPQHEEA